MVGACSTIWQKIEEYTGHGKSECYPGFRKSAASTAGLGSKSRFSMASSVSDLVTRSRSGFRAFYGPDSSQYEMIGGKRRSERKK